MNESTIKIKNLKRDYKITTGIFSKKISKIEALKDISFEVKKGEVFGLLGPNGAGKSTVMKILSTILLQTSGSVKMLNYDIKNQEKIIRPRINLITGSERNLYWRLSARENLEYFADLYKLDDDLKKNRVEELLKLVGLEERANEKVETYSKGMKQRLQIARGLINNPEILLLDEPTIGLDIVTAKELRKIIKTLSSNGTTVIFTTHYMQEAEEVCDRIAFINNGKIINIETIDSLKRIFRHKNKITVEVKSETCSKIIPILNNEKFEQFSGNNNLKKISIYTNNYIEVINKIFSNLNQEEILTLNIKNLTLEDVYLKILGDNDDKKVV